MSTEGKYREFWLGPNGVILDIEDYEKQKQNRTHQKGIKVIEAHALTDLEAKLEAAEKRLLEYEILFIPLSDHQKIKDKLQSELDKTKAALRDTADGRPSEWAYVQLKNDYDKLQSERDALKAEVERFKTFNLLKLGELEYLAKIEMLRELLREAFLIFDSFRTQWICSPDPKPLRAHKELDFSAYDNLLNKINEALKDGG